MVVILSSVILVCSRDGADGQADGVGRLASSLLRATGYAVAGWALVPDEQPLIEAAIVRHARDLGCSMILTLDTGFDCVREATLEAACEVCDFMLSADARAACGLCGGAMVVALPGREGAVYESLSSMLPALNKAIRVVASA